LRIRYVPYFAGRSRFGRSRRIRHVVIGGRCIGNAGLNRILWGIHCAGVVIVGRVDGGYSKCVSVAGTRVGVDVSS
jgi:hypothetical protein